MRSKEGSHQKGQKSPLRSAVSPTKSGEQHRKGQRGEGGVLKSIVAIGKWRAGMEEAMPMMGELQRDVGEAGVLGF